MAKKKVRKKTRKTQARSKKSKTVKKLNTTTKIKIVFNRFLFFVVLSLISFILYKYIPNNLLGDLFFIMAMIFGFISVGFVMILLILSIIKAVRKR